FGGDHFFFLFVFVLRIGIAFTASQREHQRCPEQPIKPLNRFRHKESFLVWSEEYFYKESRKPGKFKAVLPAFLRSLLPPPQSPLNYFTLPSRSCRAFK